MNVQARKILIKYEGNLIRYICPKCRQPLQFKKRIHGNSLCMRCGQRLDWNPVHDICVEVIQTQDSDESAWIAKTYYDICKVNDEDRIDIDEWRLTLRGEGAELYLLFRDNKTHGAFMRKYAKEGIIHDG